MKNLLEYCRGSFSGAPSRHELWAVFPSCGPSALAGCFSWHRPLPRRKNDGLSTSNGGFFLYVALKRRPFLGVFPGPARMAARFPHPLVYTSFFWSIALPALCRRYFTLFYAKKSTPEPFWGTDLFRMINRNMTWAWAGLLRLHADTLLPPFSHGRRALHEPALSDDPARRPL